jgi:hypothetical protein
MRRFAITVAATTILIAGVPIMGASLNAAPMVAPGAIRGAVDSLNSFERAQFIWLGHNYCWYDDGWDGPGWYWCGQYLTPGIGWGGGYGWHGWRGGHAGGVRGHGGVAGGRAGHAVRRSIVAVTSVQQQFAVVADAVVADAVVAGDVAVVAADVVVVAADVVVVAADVVVAAKANINPTMAT